MKMEPPPTDYAGLMNDNPWREGRMGVVVLAIFFGVFGLWAALAPLDAGVVAVGEVIVSGNRQVVQHREGGVISRVAVSEGDHVEQGQVLIELSAVELQAQERALAGQAIELEASRERLIAEASRSDRVQRPASWESLPPEYVTLADAILARHQDELRARRSAVKAKSQPDRMAGKMVGRVMSHITCQGREPRSIAASSIARSDWIMRACTTVVTKTMEKVMCARVMVVKPRWPGQPIQSAIRMNSISDEMPVITSGITRGAVTMPVNRTRPRKRVKRASAMPAIVPRMVAMVAEIRAIWTDSSRAAPNLTVRQKRDIPFR